MEPKYVDGANPVGFTETDIVPGVAPLPWETESQLPLEDGTAVNESCITVLDTWRFCAGAGPPFTELNVIAAGAKTSVGVVPPALTLRVTATDCGLFVAPMAAIATEPM